MKKTKLFVWVDLSNEYELPLAVADSAAELARIAGTTPNNVSSAASNFKTGRQKRSSFQVVEIKEE